MAGDSSDEVDVMISPVAVRIDRRLRTQHARWLLNQPHFQRSWGNRIRPWARANRRVMRKLAFHLQRSFAWLKRQGWLRKIAMGLLVSVTIVGAILLCYGVVVVPKMVLSAPVGRDVKLTIAETLSVGLYRVAVGLSWATGLLWLAMPGINLCQAQNRSGRASQASRADIYRLHDRSYRRVNRVVSARELAGLIGIGITVTWVALAGVLWEFSTGLTAALASIVAAILFLCAAGYFVFGIAVWIRRFRSPHLGKMPVSLFAWIATFFSGVLMLGSTLDERCVGVAGQLSKIGPYGFGCWLIGEVARGSVLAFVVVVALSTLLVGVARSLTNRASRWSHRRASVLSHRTLSDSVRERENTEPVLSRSEMAGEFRRMLRAKTIRFGWQSIRGWFLPDWFRRSWFGFVALAPPVLLVPAVIATLAHALGGVDAIQEVGSMGLQVIDADAIFRFALVGSVAGLFTLAELLAMHDRSVTSALSAEQRSRGVLESWWRDQVHGLQRTPFQLLISMPAILLIFLRPGLVRFGLVRFDWFLLVGLVSLALLVAARTIPIAFSVVSSMKNDVGRWYRGILDWMTLLIGILFMLANCVFYAQLSGIAVPKVASQAAWGAFAFFPMPLAIAVIVKRWVCREQEPIAVKE